MADEYTERNRAVATERVTLAVGVGGQRDRISVLADPADPEEGAIEDRRYFVDVEELEHGPGGVVTGIATRRYELTLTLVGDADELDAQNPDG